MCEEDVVYKYEEDCESMIYEIQVYADRYPNFSCKFVDSIEKLLNKNGRITENQYRVLQEIHKRVLSLIKKEKPKEYA
jgi:uncharacterized protein YllA (UPF0747 family)